MSTVCGFSCQANRDRITSFSTQGMAGVHTAVAILLDVTVLEALSCTLRSWRGSPRVRGMDLFYPRTRGHDTTSQYLGMRLRIRHQLEWSAVQSPSSCITDKNKKIHLKNIIQQTDGHLGFSVNFKTDRGWLRSNVFNYWEIKTRLILLRSSPAVSPQLCLGCRGRWEGGLGAGSHQNPAPPRHGPSRWSLHVQEAPRKAGAPAVHRHAYHRTALRGDAVLAWWFRHHHVSILITETAVGLLHLPCAQAGARASRQQLRMQTSQQQRSSAPFHQELRILLLVVISDFAARWPTPFASVVSAE